MCPRPAHTAILPHTQVGAFVTDHLRIHRVTLYPIGAEPTPNQVFGGFDELPAYSGECTAACCF
jgi:hypothetical protein